MYAMNGCHSYGAYPAPFAQLSSDAIDPNAFTYKAKRWLWLDRSQLEKGAVVVGGVAIAGLLVWGIASAARPRRA